MKKLKSSNIGISNFWSANKRVLFLSIIVCSVLLLETVMAKYATYVLEQNWLSLVPILIFTGITGGNLIGLIRPFCNWNEKIWLYVSAGSSIASLIGFNILSKLGYLWVMLPFICFGAFFTIVIASEEIKKILWSLAFGGIWLFFLLGSGFNFTAQYLPVISATLPLVAILVSLERKKIDLVRVFLFISASLVLYKTDMFEPRFILQNQNENFKNMKPMIDPIYTPLIRTDLYEWKNGSAVIVTNGRMFALVDSKEFTQKYFTDSEFFLASHDIPYLYKQPSSVLVIGSAEGSNIKAAIKNKADKIVAVDINPAVFQIVKGPLSELTASYYGHPNVKTVAAEGRYFLETNKEKFDLITLQGVQSGTHENSLNLVMLESYLLTEESLLTLWNSLTAEGAVWIEEYMLPIDKYGGTLIKQMADIAIRKLPIENIKQQIVLTRYKQGEISPKDKSRRRFREGLLISKTPLSVNYDKLEKIFERNNIKLVEHINENQNDSEQILKTDSRPFFVLESSYLDQGKAWVGIGIITLLLSCLGISATKSKSADVNLNMSQFFVGISFILMTMSFMGPMGLYLGDPQIATPVVFFTTFMFGLIGAFLSLNWSINSTKWSMLFSILYMLALHFIFKFFKADLLATENVMVRAVIVILLLAPLATFIEVPYIWILNKFEGSKRAYSYTIENLGSLIGVPVGLWTQINFGYFGTMVATACALSISLVFLPSEMAIHKVKTLHAALLLPMIFFVGYVLLI